MCHVTKYDYSSLLSRTKTGLILRLLGGVHASTWEMEIKLYVQQLHPFLGKHWPLFGLRGRMENFENCLKKD